MVFSIWGQLGGTLGFLKCFRASLEHWRASWIAPLARFAVLELLVGISKNMGHLGSILRHLGKRFAHIEGILGHLGALEIVLDFSMLFACVLHCSL